MYNPQVQPIGAQLLSRAFENLGQNIESGIQEYKAKKEQDAAITGTLEGMLSPQAVQQYSAIDPEFEKSVEKFNSHSMNLKDKQMFLGKVSGYKATLAEQEKKRMQDMQLQIQQQKLMQMQQQNAMGQQQQSARTQFGQYMNGQGLGVISPEVRAQYEQMSQMPGIQPAMAQQQMGLNAGMLESANQITAQERIAAGKGGKEYQAEPEIMTKDGVSFYRTATGGWTPFQKGMEVTMPDGTVISNGGNVGSSKGGNTTATQTKLQDQAKTYSDLAFQGLEVLENLKPNSVGIRGVVGENAMDRVGAQFNPDLANEGRIKSRGQLRSWREGALRSISTDNKFNKDDVERVIKIMPDDTWGESSPAARQKAMDAIDLFVTKQRAAAKELGRESIWDKSIPEILKDKSIDPQMKQRIIAWKYMKQQEQK